MTDKNFDALKATAAEVAAKIREIESQQRAAYLRASNERDLKNLGLTEREIHLARAHALLTPQEREILGRK